MGVWLGGGGRNFNHFSKTKQGTLSGWRLSNRFWDRVSHYSSEKFVFGYALWILTSMFVCLLQKNITCWCMSKGLIFWRGGLCVGKYDTKYRYADYSTHIFKALWLIWRFSAVLSVCCIFCLWKRCSFTKGMWNGVCKITQSKMTSNLSYLAWQEKNK